MVSQPGTGTAAPSLGQNQRVTTPQQVQRTYLTRLTTLSASLI